MTNVAHLHVLLAVLTYKRPAALETVLPALIEQARSLSTDSGIGTSVEILVVDNDPSASAAEFVKDVALKHPIVSYAHEATPGISAGRNRVLAESDAFDLLVFIDDDERPSEHWLAGLLGIYREYGSAAVVGPVVSEYVVEPEPWILAGRFFSRQRHPTGSVRPAAATNNLLLDLRQLRPMKLSFDERFGLSGGSDTLLTRQLVRRGGRIVWCDEAAVFDVVPQDRLTRRWVLQKAFRMGNSWVRTSLELARAPHGSITHQLGRHVGSRLGLRVVSAARGAVRVAGGMLHVVAGVVTRRLSLQARGMRTVARGAGMMAGSVGYVYSEYKRA